jgi:hypothetical protein
MNIGSRSVVERQSVPSAVPVSIQVLLIGLTLISGRESVFAQTIAWTRQLGPNTSAAGVAVDRGSIYVAGATNDDAFVRKYNADGIELWRKRFGTSASDSATAVAVDALGSIYVAGATSGTLSGQRSNGGPDAFVRKYDAGGNELWTRQFGAMRCSCQPYSNDSASAVATAPDGSIYVAGQTNGTFPGQNSNGFGFSDAFVRKYDANGNQLWTRQFYFRAEVYQDYDNGPDIFYAGFDDYARGLAVDASSNIFVAGHGGVNTRLDINSLVFVRKYDSNGRELWTRLSSSQCCDGALDEAHDVAVDSTGSSYVVGYIYYQASGFIRKYDAGGQEIWYREFGLYPIRTWAQAVTIDASGGIYVGGDSRGEYIGGTSDVFVRKYDFNGPLVWSVPFGSRSEPDYLSGMAADTGGEVYAVGSAAVGSTYEGFITKFVPGRFSVPGDVSGDGNIDCRDIAIVRAAFGVSSGQPAWDARADVVADNRIDVRDLSFVAQRLPVGTRCQ